MQIRARHASPLERDINRYIKCYVITNYHLITCLLFAHALHGAIANRGANLYLMIQICKYSEPACITPTNPDLAGNFKQSLRDGIVRDTSAHAFYNMLKECDQIGPRISDEFDFIEYDNALRHYRKKVEEESKQD